MSEQVQYAAGMRLKIRDAEWFVRAVEPVREGGQALFVRGITCPVQGRDQVFWTAVEGGGGGIEIIRPEAAELSLDTTSHGRKTRLRIESVLRSNPVFSSTISIAHHAAMDVLNYQLQPAVHALNSERDPRSRILIADAVGLGKTLEAGVLLSELMVRGCGKRILVVTLKSMMAQFQKELWCRFSIPFIRLDSVGLLRIQQEIPSHHNPFNYYDKTIISIDTLKQDNLFSAALGKARWDVVVIDEAHNAAKRKGGASQRYELAAKLANQCDHMILLTATPHDGSRSSFASLMSLLDPLAIADPEHYQAADIRDLFERRFKRDVAREIAQHFPERELRPIETANSPKEAALCAALNEAHFEMDGNPRGAEAMFRTTLIKALLSSPAAFLETAENRRDRVARERPSSPDVALLERLIELAQAIEPEDFTKYQALVEDLREGSGWQMGKARDRVVIFTESIPTAKWLEEHLAEDVRGLKGKILRIDGAMRDVRLMEVVEAFQREGDPCRVLIASDVASEGINLHPCSHRMYHFDMPWSLITFQQRNGRIDRYGQTEKPMITILLSSVAQNQGDRRVLKILLEKEQNAHDNIGDPGQLMEIFNEEGEEKVTTRAIARAIAAGDGAGEEVARAALESELASAQADLGAAQEQQEVVAEDDFFAFLDNPHASDAEAEVATPVGRAGVTPEERPTLFANEADYLRKGLQYMQEATGSAFGRLREEAGEPGLWRLELCEALKRYCRHELPYELRRALRLSEAQAVQLTTDGGTMQRTVRQANATPPRVRTGTNREEEDRYQERWPEVAYLWPLNPISSWLTENIHATFGSQAVPVLEVVTAQPLPPCFLVLGQVPNQHGEVLLQQWMAVRFPEGLAGEPEVQAGSLQTLTQAYHLDSDACINPNGAEATLSAERWQELKACREPAIKACKPVLEEALKDFLAREEPINKRRREALAGRFDAYEELQQGLLEGLDERGRQTRQRQINERIRARKAARENFERWVKAHRTPAAYRHCQLIAVLLSK